MDDLIKKANTFEQKSELFSEISYSSVQKKLEKLAGMLEYKANLETDTKKSVKLKKISKLLLIAADEIKSV